MKTDMDTQIKIEKKIEGWIDSLLFNCGPMVKEVVTRRITSDILEILEESE
jgi:hypothetical protein